MYAAQHFAFNCVDRRAQERFYVKHLGFRRARVFSAGTPGEFVMLRLGGVCLELFQARAMDAPPSAGEQPIGFKHMAFEVPDLERKMIEIQADGILPGKIIDCSSEVPGLRVCFLRDPEGNIVELMQGWQDQENPPAMEKSEE